jgi:anti-sigma B factor antagonist
VSTPIYNRIDNDNCITLQLFGKLDVITANEIRSVFDDLVAEKPPEVIIDLGGLDLIDSSGIGAIVGAYKRIRAAGGRVAVTRARDQPLTIFKLLRMDRVFGL